MSLNTVTTTPDLEFIVTETPTNLPTTADVINNAGSGCYSETGQQSEKGWKISILDGKILKAANATLAVDSNHISTPVDGIAQRWNALVERLYMQEGYIDSTTYTPNSLMQEINDNDIIAIVNDREGNVFGGIRIIFGPFTDLYTPTIIDFNELSESLNTDFVAQRDENLSDSSQINVLFEQTRVLDGTIDRSDLPDERNRLLKMKGTFTGFIWERLFGDSQSFTEIYDNSLNRNLKKGLDPEAAEKRTIKSISDTLRTIWDGNDINGVIGYRELVENDELREKILASITEFAQDSNPISVGIDLSRFVVDPNFQQAMGQDRDQIQWNLIQELVSGFAKSGKQIKMVMSFIKPKNPALVYQAVGVGAWFFNGQGVSTTTFPVGKIEEVSGEELKFGKGINRSYFTEGDVPMKGYLKDPTLLVVSIPKVT